MCKNSDYTTGNLLDYEYFSKHHKLIAVDLSKQIELENPDLKQQINFIGKLEQNSTIFFIILFYYFIFLLYIYIYFFSRKFCDCFLICTKMETQKVVNLLAESDDAV